MQLTRRLQICNTIFSWDFIRKFFIKIKFSLEVRDLEERHGKVTTRVSKTDTDSEWTDTDTIFSNYPGYTDIRLEGYQFISVFIT